MSARGAAAPLWVNPSFIDRCAAALPEVVAASVRENNDWHEVGFIRPGAGGSITVMHESANGLPPAAIRVCRLSSNCETDTGGR